MRDPGSVDEQSPHMGHIGPGGIVEHMPGVAERLKPGVYGVHRLSARDLLRQRLSRTQDAREEHQDAYKRPDSSNTAPDERPVDLFHHRDKTEHPVTRHTGDPSLADQAARDAGLALRREELAGG